MYENSYINDINVKNIHCYNITLILYDMTCMTALKFYMNPSIVEKYNVVYDSERNIIIL